jgi:acetyl-CoA carboxylase carboxyltransferase component
MKEKEIISPMPGVVINIHAKIGSAISAGDPLFVVEAMKMENIISAKENGVIKNISVKVGEVISKGQLLLNYEENKNGEILNKRNKTDNEKTERSDLNKLKEREKYLLDENRPEAVAKRKNKGQNTARENISLLADENSFKEYGGLTVAAQRFRRNEEDLIKNTPADGLICGIASINKKMFNNEPKQCCILAYDYTVLAGTQGAMNHAKMDRMLQVAQRNKLPVILFAEGGGGRPGDVDVQMVAGLHIMTFYEYAKLSGKVPTIAIVEGYCFAGNAALAGVSDVIIATENSSIGMGGPAMVEGGGLGKFHPKEIGPAEVQVKNGVIGILAKNESEAVGIAKKYLSYFQGKINDGEAADQNELRHIVPENRKRVFDVRKVIDIIADKNSVLELKKDFGKSIITAFIRIDGHPIGLIANDASETGGAITSDTANKSAEFLELCNNFKIPILSLVDTPGIMVGPEAEKTGTVKHASKLFKIGAKINVPLMAIVLRRGYGLGAMAMVGGSFHAADFIVSWPTGEFGAMGLEGAVKLGYRKELEAVTDLTERNKLYDQLLTEAYRRGEAINMAAFLEIDNVIDPAESRPWIISVLDKKYENTISRK